MTLDERKWWVLGNAAATAFSGFSLLFAVIVHGGFLIIFAMAAWVFVFTFKNGCPFFGNVDQWIEEDFGTIKEEKNDQR